MIRRLVTCVFLSAFYTLAVSSLPQAAFAAHGCDTQEPDRDEDGVPDKDDAYPDDPTRSGAADNVCGPEAPSMKIYFIPFKNETLEPVVMGKSVELASETALWIYDNEKVLEDFKSLLKRAKKPVEGKKLTLRKKMIRLKIEFPKESVVVYVDKDGTVLKNQSLSWLSEEQLDEMELKIRHISAITDLNVQRDWKDHLRDS